MGTSLAEEREQRQLEREKRERRKGRILLVVLFLAAALIVYSAVRRLQGEPIAGALGIADYVAQPTEDRRPAPPFELPALDGDGTIAIQSYIGKAVVLNFWASWCGPCRAEAPDLRRTWSRYRNRGVQFIGVNFRDDRAAAREYEREFRITYPSVFDPSGSIADDYQLFALPSTFVIGPDGWIEYHYTGIVNEGMLRGAIEDVLSR